MLGTIGMLGIGGNGKAKPDSVFTGGDLTLTDVTCFPTWCAAEGAVTTDEGMVGLFFGTGVIGGGMRASTCRMSAAGYRGVREGIMYGGNRAQVINSSGRLDADLSRRGVSLVCEGCNGIPESSLN